MRAVVIEGGELVLRDLPEPVPGPAEMLVRVHAAGVNRADLVARRGAYVVGRSLRRPSPSPTPAGSHTPSAPAPAIAGGEVAGEVVALGDDVGGFRVGDRVMAMVRGGYAEYVTVDSRRALFAPERLGWVEAAATPTTFCTAHDALATAGGLDPGDAVLVNAASSGVGVAALQLARLLGAEPVVGVSSSAAKLEALASLGIGPDHGFLADAPTLVDDVIDATGGRGVAVAIDSVGAPAWATNLAVAALGGRIVSVGRVGGHDAVVDLDEVARKRVSLVGVTFRTRDAAQAASVVSSFAVAGLAALADGRVRPIVHRTYPLEDAAAAQADLATNRHVGKLVLEVS